MTSDTERWVNAEGRYITLSVLPTGLDVEPTATVVVSYELMSQMLSDLGYALES